MPSIYSGVIKEFGPALSDTRDRVRCPGDQRVTEPNEYGYYRTRMHGPIA